MKIYRAVPRKGFDPDKVYKAHSSGRLPGNVPYVVDNLWELMRPADKPSRRHAVFACPAPELTFGNAAAGGLSPDEYLACELIFKGPKPTPFQLSKLDARHHNDVYQLPKLVNKKLGSWSDRSPESKLAFASLFLPGTTSDELAAARRGSSELDSLVEELAAAVTMWFDTPDRAVGEITFQLGAEHSYILIPV